MFHICFKQVRLRYASISLLLLLAACGTAETGGSSEASSAQPTSGASATAMPATRAQPTTAPTQGSDLSAIGPTSTASAIASHGGAVNDQVSLVDRLRQAGANVQL